jgi:hypothetical protein
MRRSVVKEALLAVLLFCAPALGEVLWKQNLFAEMSTELIRQAQMMGYQVTLGEAWRPAEIALLPVRQYAQAGKGIIKSLHLERMAIDINLFRNGHYLSDTQDYRLLGEWWENQYVVGVRPCWGGRFHARDGNHFSFEHEGRK